MWGFALLAVSTTLNYAYNPKGFPLPIWDNVRITGNLGGVLLAAGLIMTAYRRSGKFVKQDYASDYLFLALLATAVVTGFVSELGSELNAATLTYAAYVTHLLSCAMLLGTAPFTKFIHAVGIPILRLSENCLETLTRSGKKVEVVVARGS